MTPVPAVATGLRQHVVTLQNPSASVPDGDGGYTQTWVALVPPQLCVRIQPASARDLQYVAGGTVASSATHLVTGPYHPSVTTQTRLLFGSRTFHVAGVTNVEERGIEMVLLCEEHVA